MKTELKGKNALISVGGDLRGDSSKEFVESLRSFIAEDIRRFTVDFAGVSFADTYTVSSLIILCNKPDIEFTFRNVGKPLMNIFSIAEFGKRVLFE